jgi:hypothetical protein
LAVRRNLGRVRPSLRLREHLRRCGPERPRQPVGSHDRGAPLFGPPGGGALDEHRSLYARNRAARSQVARRSAPARHAPQGSPPAHRSSEGQRKVGVINLLRTTLAALLLAPQPLSCAPQAPRTPPPSLPQQRSAQALWRQPPSSPIHRKGRRPDHPLYSRLKWRGAGVAGASGWDDIHEASPCLERKGCTRRRRAGK